MLSADHRRWRMELYLLAECCEGPGSNLLLEFMKDVNSPDEAFNKFQSEEFRIGPHKAFQLAKQAKRVHIGLVSSLDSSTCEQFFCSPLTVENITNLLDFTYRWGRNRYHA